MYHSYMSLMYAVKTQPNEESSLLAPYEYYMGPESG